MQSLSPIIIFVYNRLHHTEKTVVALQNNSLSKESNLFIFSDGAKDESDAEKVHEVRLFLKTISGFKKVEIIEREKNMGLANSIISGVTQIINQYGKVIVLEDDMVTSTHFLEYMNKGLDMYEYEEKVASIHAYVYPTQAKLPETFFIRGTNCWGWATWKRAWDMFESNGAKLLAQLEQKNLTKEFDFNDTYHYTHMLERQIAGLNNSWAVRWYASAFLANKLTLYPGRTLITNIGQDGSGTHHGTTNPFGSGNLQERITLQEIPIVESALARTEITSFFQSLQPTYITKIMMRIKKFLTS